MLRQAREVYAFDVRGCFGWGDHRRTCIRIIPHAQADKVSKLARGSHFMENNPIAVAVSAVRTSAITPGPWRRPWRGPESTSPRGWRRALLSAGPPADRQTSNDARRR